MSNDLHKWNNLKLYDDDDVSNLKLISILCVNEIDCLLIYRAVFHYEVRAIYYVTYLI